MNPEFFIINAYRHGLRESHSYSLGVMQDINQAIEIAEQHCTDRGGLYSVTVEKTTFNEIDLDAEEYTKEVYRAKARNDTPEYHRAWAMYMLERARSESDSGKLREHISVPPPTYEDKNMHIKECCVDGCSKPVHRLNACKQHYKNIKNSADEENFW